MLTAFNATGTFFESYVMQATHFFDGAPTAPKHRFTPFALCARSLASGPAGSVATTMHCMITKLMSLFYLQIGALVYRASQTTWSRSGSREYSRSRIGSDIPS